MARGGAAVRASCAAAAGAANSRAIAAGAERARAAGSAHDEQTHEPPPHRHGLERPAAVTTAQESLSAAAPYDGLREISSA